MKKKTNKINTNNHELLTRKQNGPEATSGWVFLSLENFRNPDR